MDPYKKMTRQELHDLLDANLDELRGDVTGVLMTLAARRQDDTEVVLSGRNIDPRVSLYAILQEYQKEGGDAFMAERLNDVLAKVMEHRGTGGVIIGSPESIRRQLDEKLKEIEPESSPRQKRDGELPQRPPRL
jgi:hypothetical protein